MNIQVLPNDLSLESIDTPQIYDYHINTANLKSKINLTQHVFSFLIHGTKDVITNQKPIKIQNNQFLIIKSGNCLMTENLSENKTYQSILFFFTDEMMVNFILRNKIQLSKKQDVDPYIVCDYDDYIHNFVKSLSHIIKKERTLQKRLLQVKFDEILFYIIHTNGNDFIEIFSQTVNPHQHHFENVIQNNVKNQLSIQELAFLCNMSSSTFKRHFEKYYNTSPIKWFQDKRLEHAFCLLQTKSNRPTDIFSAAGFESLSSFTQAFKQKYGSTPKQVQLQK